MRGFREPRFLLFVELLSQVRLRNRKIVEDQIQLRNGQAAAAAGQESIGQVAKLKEVIE